MFIATSWAVEQTYDYRIIHVVIWNNVGTTEWYETHTMMQQSANTVYDSLQVPYGWSGIEYPITAEMTYFRFFHTVLLNVLYSRWSEYRDSVYRTQLHWIIVK